MKTYLILAASVLLMSTAASAAPADTSNVDAQLARCERLKRQADRDTCIKEAMRTPAAGAQSTAATPKPVAPKEPPSILGNVKFPVLPEIEWRREITIKTDEFSKNITYSAKEHTDGSTYGTPEYEWSVKGYVEKATSQFSAMIVFSDSYTGNRWKFWKYADTDQAEKLDTVVGSRKVSSCSRYSGCLYFETMGIVVTKEFLVSAANNGREIKLTSSNGDSYILRVSSDEASNLLSAVSMCRNTGCLDRPAPGSESRHEVDIKGETLISIFDRLVAPHVGKPGTKAGSMFVSQGKFLCGSLVSSDEATGRMTFKQFATNPETKAVYVEGMPEWNANIWSTYCQSSSA